MAKKLNLKGDFPQHKIAAKTLIAGKIYVRTAPHGSDYGDLRAGCGAAYILEKGKVVTICHNTNIHRLKKAIKAYPDYKKGKIPAWVWENYINNGYLTRRGLYANYSDANKDRISRIAKSHADYLGRETKSSKYDHEQRVRARN